MEISFSVSARPEASSLARAAAGHMFGKTPLSEREQNRLKLVFAEIFMNAIGYGSAEDDTIDMKFIIYEEKIRVEVADHGTKGYKITPEELKRIINFQSENDNITKTSGRGLAQITQKWTDNFDVKNTSEKGGITIIFEKNFPSEEEIAKRLEESKIKTTKATNRSVPQPIQVEKPAELEDRVFKFKDEIDESNINESVREIENFFESGENKGKRVILDFSELRFFVSTFIGRIVAWKQLAEQAGAFKIINVSNEAYDILDLVGITRISEVEKK